MAARKKPTCRCGKVKTTQNCSTYCKDGVTYFYYICLECDRRVKLKAKYSKMTREELDILYNTHLVRAETVANYVAETYGVYL